MYPVPYAIIFLPPSFYNFTYVPLTCCLANFLPRPTSLNYSRRGEDSNGKKKKKKNKKNSNVHRIFPRTRLFIELYIPEKKKAKEWLAKFRSNFFDYTIIRSSRRTIETLFSISKSFRNHYENTTILDSMQIFNLYYFADEAKSSFTN